MIIYLTPRNAAAQLKTIKLNQILAEALSSHAFIRFFLLHFHKTARSIDDSRSPENKRKFTRYLGKTEGKKNLYE